ncbi:hypothetical protein BGZ60DRAFT_553556 [Tricladium varicosporioides]|nr:hypothetical protein BGZ60DRAFT_553556 [Hymenoscyphus varicosporioides]
MSQDGAYGPEFKVDYYGSGDKFNPIDHNYDFHTFPQRVGWELNDSTSVLTKNGELSNDRILDFNQFLQSWLFFGLLATVLCDPKWDPEDFILDQNTSIHTKNLPDYLTRWEERESNDQTHKGRIARTLRMIKAEVALIKAQKIVLKYCSSEEEKDTIKGPEAVDPHLSLALMVLGETLTNAKSKIVERVGFNVRGWHGDANEGWGTPSCVIKKMEESGWCKRTIYMLRGQLRSHVRHSIFDRGILLIAETQATSLLSVYKVHTFDATFKGHDKCTWEACILKSTGDDGKYKTKHHPTCVSHGNPEGQGCRMIGPEIEGMNGVVQIIEDGYVPLLEHRKVKLNGKDDWEVYPIRRQKFQDYATISHVWADGYGNPFTNKLWQCQLEFFFSLLDTTIPAKMPSLKCKLFWIDTLVIPVDKKYEVQRKKAIEQINDVFTSAKYTIVVDNALTEMSSGDNYESTAMKILASGWMRRLWTLQEAYLSKRLLFAFKGKDVRNLDDLEEMYPQASHILTSNIPTTARNYFHNLLGGDRKNRIHEVPTANNYALLASIWRAAQWRVGRREHETLALATMLNLDYRDRPAFARVGLPTDITTTLKKSEHHDLEAMMKELWLLLDETSPGSIPSGIIFLPGKRMTTPGFGWAPESWMSGQKVDYPDPLSTMVSAAKLDRDKGLLVQYPGILLHAQNPNSILGTSQKPIQFPVDSTLLEFYEVEHADRSEVAKGTFLERALDLAIILCRPKPRDLAEIALLVEIRREITQRGIGIQGSSKTYEVFIVRRVKIKRVTGLGQLSEWMGYVHQASHEDDKFICGELLDSDQKWYVDGYPNPIAPSIRPPASALPTILEQPREVSIPILDAEASGNKQSWLGGLSSIQKLMFQRTAHKSQMGETGNEISSLEARNGVDSDQFGVGKSPKRSQTIA